MITDPLLRGVEAVEKGLGVAVHSKEERKEGGPGGSGSPCAEGQQVFIGGQAQPLHMSLLISVMTAKACAGETDVPDARR